MMTPEVSVTDRFVGAVAEIITTIVDTELARPIEAVWRKNGTEPVTTADVRIETRLAAALKMLLPTSSVVGEEESHRSPHVLGRLDGRRPVWLIDPIDGTSSFIDGGDRYSTLVSLCVAGRAVVSWTYAPKLATMMTATETACAINQVPLPAVATCPSGTVVITNPAFWTGIEAEIERRISPTFSVTYCDGVGIEYMDIARGAIAGVVFTWNKPWDHLAGLLAVSAVGGINAVQGNRPFTPNGPNPLPLVAGEAGAVRTLLELIGPTNGTRNQHKGQLVHD